MNLRLWLQQAKAIFQEELLRVTKKVKVEGEAKELISTFMRVRVFASISASVREQVPNVDSEEGFSSCIVTTGAL